MTKPRKPWRVTKRDGRQEDFDGSKIAHALRRCFSNGLGLPPAVCESKSEHFKNLVLNILSQQAKSQPLLWDVEDVQRLIIQQLWAEGEFDAAEHYQNHREKRRKERLISPSQPDPAVAEDAAFFGSNLRYYQFLSKYARWNDKAKRRETWREACERVMTFMKARPALVKVPEPLWGELYEGLYHQRASCAMRVLQMAGPALERCNVGAFNCTALDVDCLEAFPEILYVLMQGCGVGFSVESECIDKLPRVRKQRGSTIDTFSVPDTTEGWCDALLYGIRAWFSGGDVVYDYSRIRLAGAPLKTKGGRASGSEPLKALLTFARDKILSRQGSRLTDLDCHDLCCMIGKIVQVGGVRRSAQISISDLDSQEMRLAKHGAWWDKAPMRDMANNSAAYDEVPDPLTFMKEWLALAESGSGERGIFNRCAGTKSVPVRRKRVRFLPNPCGEIWLRSCQMCNLSIVIARHDDTEQSLREKVRLAAVWGTLQSTLTDFQYLRPVWKQNCDEERLLGVDITGQQDCRLLRYGARDRAALLRRLQQLVLETNAEFADLLGIPRSTATTCVKPSGNSAQLFGCSSGVHVRYARYQIRRFRAGLPELDPLSRFLKDQGVPCNPDPMNPSLVVFDFLPEPALEGTPTRDDLTAIQQLEYWHETNRNWAEHSVSCTIYVKPEEWLPVGNWVYGHFSEVNSLAFLPKDGGTYRLMPNEEVSEEQYLEMVKKFPKIDWGKLASYEHEDVTAPLTEPVCSSGACDA